MTAAGKDARPRLSIGLLGFRAVRRLREGHVRTTAVVHGIQSTVRPRWNLTPTAVVDGSHGRPGIVGSGTGPVIHLAGWRHGCRTVTIVRQHGRSVEQPQGE